MKRGLVSVFEAPQVGPLVYARRRPNVTAATDSILGGDRIGFQLHLTVGELAVRLARWLNDGAEGLLPGKKVGKLTREPFVWVISRSVGAIGTVSPKKSPPPPGLQPSERIELG